MCHATSVDACLAGAEMARSCSTQASVWARQEVRGEALAAIHEIFHLNCSFFKLSK